MSNEVYVSDNKKYYESSAPNYYKASAIGDELIEEESSKVLPFSSPVKVFDSTFYDVTERTIKKNGIYSLNVNVYLKTDANEAYYNCTLEIDSPPKYSDLIVATYSGYYKKTGVTGFPNVNLSCTLYLREGDKITCTVYNTNNVGTFLVDKDSLLIISHIF